MSNCFLRYPERPWIYLPGTITLGREQPLLQSLGTYSPPVLSFLQSFRREVGALKGDRGERGALKCPEWKWSLEVSRTEMETEPGGLRGGQEGWSSTCWLASLPALHPPAHLTTSTSKTWPESSPSFFLAKTTHLSPGALKPPPKWSLGPTLESYSLFPTRQPDRHSCVCV